MVALLLYKGFISPPKKNKILLVFLSQTQIKMFSWLYTTFGGQFTQLTTFSKHALFQIEHPIVVGIFGQRITSGKTTLLHDIVPEDTVFIESMDELDALSSKPIKNVAIDNCDSAFNACDVGEFVNKNRTKFNIFLVGQDVNNVKRFMRNTFNVMFLAKDQSEKMLKTPVLTRPYEFVVVQNKTNELKSYKVNPST